MEGSAAVLVLVALGAIYFLPSIIAGSRGHMAAAIVTLNLLVGWTALGWILALVWSLTSNTRENLQYLATGERSSPSASAPRVIAAPRQTARGWGAENSTSRI
jgi:Superinfection immunity protein